MEVGDQWEVGAVVQARNGGNLALMVAVDDEMYTEENGCQDVTQRESRMTPGVDLGKGRE